MKIRRSISP